jgi:outer membrane protein assembly factor BamB
LIDRDGETPARTATATPTATASPTVTATEAPVARATRTVRRVGDRPTGIAYAGGDLWVASPDSAYLTRIVAETGTEREQHPKVGRDVQAIAASGGGVWVAVSRDRLVRRIGVRTGKQRDRLEVPGEPRRLAVDDDDVWVTTASVPGAPGLVLRYDSRSGRLEQTFTVPEGVSAIAATPETIWIVKRDTNMLARLVGDAFEETVNALGAVRSMSYGGGRLWLVFDEENTIGRYEMDWRIPVTGATGAAPMAALVAGDHLFITNRNDQSVLVLDPDTLRPRMDPIPVALNPIALAEGDGAVWVTSLVNTVTRIDYR